VNRRVVLGAVAAAVVVLLGWYLLLWSPATKSVKDAKKRATAAQSQQEELQAEITRLKEAQRNEPANQAKLEALRAAIPDDPALGQFIIDVNDAANRSGIQFVSISPSEPKAPTATASAVPSASGTATTATTAPGTQITSSGPAPAEIAVSLQIKGGYFQVLDFLNRLDAMPRLVVTDSINVSADEHGGLTVGLTSRIFVRSIPAGFAGAPATTSTTAGGGSTTTTAAGGSTTSTTAGARP
jgi:Tfp pilus assembly protein PilO